MHSLHEVTLLDAAYCPFPQDLQLLASVYVVAVVGWYRPAVQEVHDAAIKDTA